VWISLPGQSRRGWGDEGRTPGTEEGRSNTGLWIGLAIGGVVLVLLVVCGGIGGLAYFWSSQRMQAARLAEVQARGNLQMGAVPFQTVVPVFREPTEFPPQNEDYAEARKNFKTKLLWLSPAPQLEDPNRPVRLPPEAEEINYVSGQLQLRAWVSRDPSDGKEKKPAVLFLHDGFAFGNEDWDQAKPFRDAGYVVMMPMLRGENNQPGNFSLFYDEVDDVLAAADALEKLPYVDGKRMYLAGHSGGGTLTLLTALTTSRFRAAGAISGSPDQVNWVGSVRPNMGGYGGNSGAVPFDESDEKEPRMRSPLAFAESFKCPTRLYVGGQETFFKACAEKTVEKAKKKNLDVEVVVVPGDHINAVNNAIPKCIEFFKEHSEPAKKQEPAKTGPAKK
jgi:dienelactone hydrolase